MNPVKKILIIQTAFPGDLILTLPLAQALREHYPDARIDMIAIPKTAGLLDNHPAISNVIIYDKKGIDRGIKGLLRMKRLITAGGYDTALIPHRSLRSALLAWCAGIPARIGFDISRARFLYTTRVKYLTSSHEIDRNLSLIASLKIGGIKNKSPKLYPSAHDREKVGLMLSEFGIGDAGSIVGVAPGSVWPTKRWPEGHYLELVKMIIGRGFDVVLLGGADDTALCSRLVAGISDGRLHNLSGKLTFLQSAELISRCRLVVTNDSAPLHLSVSVETAAVAIFGPTVPEFGFGPYGTIHSVVELKGLKCRPCSIHGGNRCPIGTFECMKNISPRIVMDKVDRMLERRI